MIFDMVFRHCDIASDILRHIRRRLCELKNQLTNPIETDRALYLMRCSSLEVLNEPHCQGILTNRRLIGN